jgi:hypothetical protein
MVNTVPISNNLNVYKTLFSHLSSVPTNQISRTNELFVHLLEQALLQAQMTDTETNTSMNPVNLTALGLNSAFLGSNVYGTSLVESTLNGSRINDSVKSQPSNTPVSIRSVHYQDMDINILNTQLEGTLKNTGSIFIEAGKKFQINPAFLAAVSMHETGNGSSNASRFKNNVAGMMGKSGLKSYATVEESIYDMARNLRKNYLDDGKMTLSQIGAKYAPVGAPNDPTGLNNHWVNGVQNCFDQLTKAK